MERKLGRGLNSLIERTAPTEEGTTSTVECDRIAPNPYQPRERMDEGSLGKLADSIRTHGVLQPVVLRSTASGYEMVAGERRLRACRLAGLERIPAVLRTVSDDQMLEIALVENLQREDLNPIEKARAYRRYLDEVGVTHEEASRRLGKDRSTITNQIRLLDLSDDLQAMVSRGTLAMGHARALLGLSDEERRRQLARRIVEEGLSVREAERLVRREGSSSASPARTGARAKSPHIEDLERRLRERYATKAHISGGRKKGRISLEYYSMDELTRLLEMLLGRGPEA